MSSPTKKRLLVENLGKVGIVPDQTPLSLPKEAWSDGSNNIRFSEGKVQNFPGWSLVATNVAEAGFYPFYHVQPARNANGDQTLIFCANNYAYLTDGDALVSITRASGVYGWTVLANVSGTRFTGGDFHGVAIVNNPTDYPQASVSLPGTLLDDLKWDATQDWAAKNFKCWVIRPFQNILMAGNMTEAGTRKRHRIRWSDIADGGAVPATWDEADATALAGAHDLSETDGSILDMLPLVDAMIIYKDDAIYRADYVGAPYMFDFNLVSTELGVINTNCAVDIGSSHIFWDRKGPHIFDGSRFAPLAYGTTRAEMLDDAANHSSAYLLHHQARNEVWFCYCSVDADEVWPDRAWVYNYSDKTWSKTDLPVDATLDGVPSMCTCDSLGTVWNWTDLSIVKPVGLGSYLPGTEVIYSAGSVVNLLGADAQEAGVSRTCVAERRGLAIGNVAQHHMVTAIYPHMWASGGSVNIYIGTQDQQSGAVTWSDAKPFVPGTDRKVDCRATGPLHAIKFESAADMNWILTGYELEYSQKGRR